MLRVQFNRTVLDDLKLDNILFLDMETVPLAPQLEDVSPLLRRLWEQKSSTFRKTDEPAAGTWPQAALYAEFGKIVCISAGIFSGLGEPKRFRIKSFAGENETAILEDFSRMVRKFRPAKDLWLCAHNGKEFDLPYLARRMMIKGQDIPVVLQVAGRKPWEVRVIDTMELWKFGAYKNFCSLALLTEVLGIPNPKEDMDGSQVARIFYQEKDLERIMRYCEKDVLAVAQILLRFRGDQLIPEENVEIVT